MVGLKIKVSTLIIVSKTKYEIVLEINFFHKS